MKTPGRIALGLIFTTCLLVGQDRPIRVGGQVQQANIVSRVAPVYPADAKRDHVQGKVSLEVTIDKEGHVVSVSPLEGPQVLVQSAVDVNYTLAD